MIYAARFAVFGAATLKKRIPQTTPSFNPGPHPGICAPLGFVMKAIFTLLCSLLLITSLPAATKRPNILVITTDDVGIWNVGL